MDLVGKKAVRRGIYKIEKGKLYFCRPIKNSAQRPAKFSSGQESGTAVIVWQRAPI